MKIIPIVLLFLLSACAVKPAPICMFCDQDLNGQYHSDVQHKPTKEVAK